LALKPKFGFVDSELEQIRKHHLYRKLKSGKAYGATITINGKKLLNLGSNDYLGIHPSNLNIKQMQSSSRLISGNDESFEILEKKLARHKTQQSALIYPTGYMANLGVVSSIAKKGDLILSDELNHTSIIEACKLSGAKISVYKHNDMQDLQKKIREKAKSKFVITEGIFSMDGDFSQLSEITEIAQKHNAITILDDAHGDFVVGNDGKGTANHLRVSKKIDLYISSLSKGLGSFGGYVAAKSNVIDLCVNKSKSFIYTSALPSFLIQYSLRRFEANREKNRKKLEQNTRQIISGLKEIGYPINSQTQIIPIIVGNEKATLDFGEFLFKKGIFAQPIRFPTVPKNQARIRLSVTGWLSKKDIENTLNIFDSAFVKFLR
jgi:glycine C-acetyltransferase